MGNKTGIKRGKYNHYQPPRRCQFPGCSNIFQPENANQHYCKSTHYATCIICGSKYEVKNLASYPDTCSRKCAYQKRRNTMKSRYGVEYVLQDKQFLEKCKKTNQKHLGVDYPSQSDEVVRKRKISSLNRYGVSHPMKSKEVKDHIRQTIRSRYNVDWTCQLDVCRNSYNHKDSIPNILLRQYMKDNHVECEYEFPLGRYVYDCHILNSNILIEINPTATHNSYFSPWNTPKNPYYHRKKFELAASKGFICIHIFDWMDCKAIIQDILKSKEIRYNDLGYPQIHWYNYIENIHIVDKFATYHNMVRNKFYPVYDSGYKLEFIF